MGMEIWIVTAILVVAIILLVTEKLPVDLTSIGIMLALTISGILTPIEAISGFANPAVITVGAMFLISKGMIRTGAVGFVGQKVLDYSRGNPSMALLLVLVIVGTASAFINNTPIVVLFIPIVISICCEIGLSPSKFLIPVSYASILAGTCTLIGTSTNIIVSDLSAEFGLDPIGMFELSSLGVPIAILGIGFLTFMAPRVMPDASAPVCELRNKNQRRYLAEFSVPEDSALIGLNPRQYFNENLPGVDTLEVIRHSHVLYPGRDHVKVAANDLILLKGSANHLVEILNTDLAKLPFEDQSPQNIIGQDEILIVELILTPQSSLIGERLADSHLARNPDLHIIAIQRSGLHYIGQKLQNSKLKIGDILLMRCPESELEKLRGETDFIVVEDVHHEIIHKRLARRALVIFGGMILAASTGLADILVCAMAAALLIILSGCLQLRDAYRSIEARVLLIIIGTIALSAALEKTGASAFYARTFLNLFEGVGPGIILSAILVLTSVSSQIVSNNATAILILPIAISTAIGLGVDPRPFVVAVCFGASACFATPIGYQTNLLVYGPGSYRFSDFLKLGIPLNLIVLIMGSLFIPYFWPF